MFGLFVSVDVVTSAVVLAALAVAATQSGLPLRPLLGRVAPLLVGAAGIGTFNAIVGGTGVAGGLAVGLRVVGISFAGILAVATIEPTELADALVQHLRAPSRFVVGALAAFRLFPLFSREWDTLGLARRARGIEADRAIGDRLAAFPGRALSLLVAALRRATRLALAMDARGFGALPCRTLARPRDLLASDLALVGGAALLVALAIGTSISVGAWRPLFLL